MGKQFAWELIGEFAIKLLNYLPITLLILVLGILLAVLVGFLLALPRLYRLPFLSQLAYLFLSYARGTPILVQLFIVYFGLPGLLQGLGIDVSRLEPIFFVVIAYGLNWGAWMSENIRASIQSVSQGQLDAAYSIGMTAPLALRRIVLPQALVVAVPNFANLVFTALKGTSLAFYIGVQEMLFRVNSLGAAVNHFLEAYIAAAIIYYCVYLVLSKAFKITERRVGAHRRQLVEA